MVEPIIYKEDVSIPYPPDLPFPLGERRVDDVRSEGFLMSQLVAPVRLATLPTYKYWRFYTTTMAERTSDRDRRIVYARLNQSNCHRRDSRDNGDPYGCGHCVGYGMKHFLLLSPVTNPQRKYSGSDIYFRAQDQDEWSEPKDQYGQEPYQGSSMTGGFKALRALGLVSGWANLRTVEEVWQAVLGKGPVVLATNWLTGMFYPKKEKGYVLDVTGSNAGGHLYVIDGGNRSTGLLRIANSWGVNWGNAGYAYIRATDLAKLMAQRAYPAATATEILIG